MCSNLERKETDNRLYCIHLYYILYVHFIKNKHFLKKNVMRKF